MNGVGFPISSRLHAENSQTVGVMLNEKALAIPNSSSELIHEPQATSAARFRYVIITPARNEAANIETTILSVVAQTKPPAEWILVNDGSTDSTAEVLDRYAARYSWIRVFHLPDRGFREPGGGVIRAFNYGLNQLKTKDWDFIVKLDGDLELPVDYFENCLEEFANDDSLAVGGGTICHNTDGVLRPDVDVSFHVRGATKIYRRTFWDQNGRPHSRCGMGHPR